ncbi:MAG: 3'-5' exonuclease [Anoxybacillus sp.]|nr:exonuclease domain-containing protein [Anoxybacillus sp.]MCL6586881.1 3'-5' exonuclease [Anoxybacillus sp.]
MNEQHRFWQRALRMLSLGVPSEKIFAVPENERHSFQQEVWVRMLLKEQQKKQLDMHMRLEHVPFVIIDTETTGFSPQHGDEIFAIAAAKTNNGDVTDFYFRLIRPEKTIPEHISELTGIRTEDVQSAPRLKDEMDRFLSFIREGMLIGYHIGHDLSFINHFLWTNYRTKWTGRFLEMRQVMEMLHRPLLFPTLDEALSYYNVRCEQRHTADGDVQAMVRLWKCMLNDIKQKQLDTLYDLYTALSVMPR